MPQRSNLRSALLAIVVFASILTPTITANAHHATTQCPEGEICEFPSPQDCAAGGHTGVWDGGGPPGRGSICVGAADHNALYVGGDPSQGCGAVIVADLNVLDGPTTHTSSDPNACPHFGWQTEIHDPAVAKHKNTYYLFGTGPGVPIWRSNNLRKWHSAGRVFSGDLPSWTDEDAIHGANFPWAPDISYFGGKWHLYYSLSTFGSKTSAIGVATSPTLDRDDPGYAWTDHGVVVRSDNTSDYNAIDPNVTFDADGRPWLNFGSFNSGIKLLRLDPSTGKPPHDATLEQLASRAVPTWGIEAPFIVERAGYYYLFVSFDNCCRGSESTYNIRVGRSSRLNGPYVDDRGVPLLAGGGRLLLEGEGSKRGPGHNAVLNDGGKWRLFFHYYDAASAGTAKLGIVPIAWTTDGWPAVDWSMLIPTKVSPPDGA